MSTTPRDEDAVAGLKPDPAVLAAVDEVDSHASAEVMSLLTEHVPLALLADLASPQGPASPQILDEEGLPEVEWWGAGEHETAADAGIGEDERDPAQGPTDAGGANEVDATDEADSDQA